MLQEQNRQQPYNSEPKDPIDQHVAQFLKYHPELVTEHSFFRKQKGVYELDGRELHLEPSDRGLVVVDGPLRQPMADYIACSEKNAEYDVQGIGVDTNLHSIPREKRMSFHDCHKVYGRLEAMKVAKEQAIMRERAAEYTKDGREVPKDAWFKVYKNNLSKKMVNDPPTPKAPTRRKLELEPPEVASESTPAPAAYVQQVQATGSSMAPALMPQMAPVPKMQYQQWAVPAPGPPGQPPWSGAPAPPPKAWPEPVRYQLPAPSVFQPVTLSPPPSGFPPPPPAAAVFQAQR